MEPKISYGKSIETNLIKHISEVPNGLICGCTCVACGDNLVAANKGKIQQHHFRHSHDSECPGGLETALHLLAKQIILEAKSIRLTTNLVFEYEKCEIEKIVLDIKPDLVISNASSNEWLIEIAVTHFLDEVKIKKIRDTDLNCIEIDLSRIDRDIEPLKLKEILLNQVENKKVIHRTGDRMIKEDPSGCLTVIFVGILAAFGFNWIWKSS